MPIFYREALLSSTACARGAVVNFVVNYSVIVITSAHFSSIEEENSLCTLSLSGVASCVTCKVVTGRCAANNITVTMPLLVTLTG